MDSLEVKDAVAMRGFRPLIPSNMNSSVVSLIKQCWQQDSNARPLFPTIMVELEAIAHVLEVPASILNSEANKSVQR
jgi:hypothetical protein